MNNDFNAEKNKQFTLKLRALLLELPLCCGEFFRGIENTTSVLTRYGYAIDLKNFFQYLVATFPEFFIESIRDITLAQIAQIHATHIEMYLEYLTLYEKNDREITNQERTKARKLSAVRSFFKYFYKKEKLPANPAALIDMPKLHQKAIVRLEADEVANLLDYAEDGTGLSPTQLRYHRQTSVRDTAILTLFLGTGIRISELVGIDIDDINFMTNQFTIIRKGGNQDTLSFGEETRAALLTYLMEREEITPLPGHENAFFLSMQKRRITPRAVENLVKKYASIAAPLKKISPHKLRSTYGTMLYQETGDIYLVADVLGHKDVNTTKKHYAALSEDRRRLAAKAIKLRDDSELKIQ